jgi:beta-lactamase regulating signal transducer with metallopeptidase domain
MDAIYKFISPETVYALGIMLMHFMWQALVLALFLGLFMLLTRKSSPVPRYYAAVFSLFMMPVMAIYAFISAIRSIEVVIAAHPDYAVGAGKLLSGQNLVDKFFSLYSSYIPIIVFLWFIGITALLLKNLGGLMMIQRLKNYYIAPVGEQIQQMIGQIQQRYLIKRTILPLLSSKATAPMVIGHFKPVVLIPEKLTSNLSSEEMKIVLQHELAHIKRNDFLINIFQLIVESLFFFHPATWWISAIARQEREECCDAIAAQTGDEKITLAKALASIQEYKLKSNSMAVAFLNKKSGLYNRIKGIFGNRPSTPSFREGVIVMLFMFLIVTLMSFVINDKPKDAERKRWKTINTELSNGDFMYAKVDSAGTIRELYVNGEKVRKGKYAYYQPKVDSLQWQQSNDAAPEMNEAYKNELDSSELKDLEEGMEKMKGIDPAFSFKTNDKDGQVDMSATKNGFKMNVNDGKDQVDMHFDEKGGHMIIKTDGKTTFQMNIGSDGTKMITDSFDNKEKVKK